MANRDALTRLWTRECLDAELPQHLSEAIQARRPLSLVMVDIDHFKVVNDTHGHQQGDAVLAGVAAAIGSVAEGKGRVYRYGGEEITVVLPNHTREEALAVAERARRELESAQIAGLRVTASFGVGTCPDHGRGTTEIIKAADTALYDAKNRGRNLVRYFGEPEPSKEPAREPERKAPAPGVLTEKQKAELRSQHFQGNLINCPNDRAILNVAESNEAGSPRARLLVWYKMCGLMDEL